MRTLEIEIGKSKAGRYVYMNESSSEEVLPDAGVFDGEYERLIDELKVIINAFNNMLADQM